MTHDELFKKLGPDELNYWIAKNQLRPIDPTGWLRAGAICRAIYQVNSKKRIRLEDCIPGEKESNKATTAESQKALLSTMLGKRFNPKPK